MMHKLLSLIPSAAIGFVVLMTGANPPIPIAVVPQADCVANGCNAYFDVYSPTHHLLTGGTHPTQGHGQCICLGELCLEHSPCNITHPFTVDAQDHWICKDGILYGHDESFVVTVSDCDPAKAGEVKFTIRKTADCVDGTVLETATFRVYCKKCRDHDGMGCP